MAKSTIAALAIFLAAALTLLFFEHARVGMLNQHIAELQNQMSRPSRPQQHDGNLSAGIVEDPHDVSSAKIIAPPSNQNDLHKRRVINQLAATSKHIRDQRLIYSRREIQREIGTVLEGLGLPEDTVADIKVFLLERTAVALDAQDLAKEQQLSYEGMNSAVLNAQHTVDDEMRQAFPPEVFSTVQDVLKQYVAYSQIGNAYGPDMAFAGVPLDTSQTKALAATLYNTFSAAVNPDAPRQRMAVDPTSGLSAADSSVLEHAAPFLSQPQLAILQIDLAGTTGDMMRAQTMHH